MAVASLPALSLPHQVMNHKRPECADILSGWKDVATYMKMGVRTVQRYERDLGLPVRRPGAKPHGSVIAKKTELDAWVTARPARETIQVHHHVVGDTPLNELRHNVSELRQLRQQSAVLRQQVHEALKVLHENLRSQCVSKILA